MHIPYVSKSRLETFSCPLKYFYKYEKEIKDEPNDAMRFGTLMHSVMEKFNNEFAGGNIATLDKMIEWYKELFKGSKLPQGKFETGLAMLRNFIPPLKTWKVLGVEKEFTLTLSNGVPIYGFIDAIYEDGDTIYVEDYKVPESDYVPTQYDIDKDIQLQLYHLAAEELFPGKKIVTCLHGMTYGRIYANHTKEQMDDFLDFLEVQYNMIREDDGSTANPSNWNCKRCYYQDKCKTYQDIISGKAIAEYVSFIPSNLDKAIDVYLVAKEYENIAKAAKERCAKFIEDHMLSKGIKLLEVPKEKKIRVIKMIQAKREEYDYDMAFEAVKNKNPNEIRYCFSMSKKKVDEVLDGTEELARIKSEAKVSNNNPYAKITEKLATKKGKKK